MLIGPPDAIEDGLWVGPEPRTPEAFRMLADLGVQDILSLLPEEESRASGVHPTVAFRIASGLGMAHHRCPIDDFSSRSMRSKLPEAVELLTSLRERGRRVYVHCAVGQNRSPTVVAAYLKATRNLDGNSACEEVMRLHPCRPDIDAVRMFKP